MTNLTTLPLSVGGPAARLRHPICVRGARGKLVIVAALEGVRRPVFPLGAGQAHVAQRRELLRVCSIAAVPLNVEWRDRERVC